MLLTWVLALPVSISLEICNNQLLLFINYLLINYLSAWVRALPVSTSLVCSISTICRPAAPSPPPPYSVLVLRPLSHITGLVIKTAHSWQFAGRSTRKLCDDCNLRAHRRTEKHTTSVPCDERCGHKARG